MATRDSIPRYRIDRAGPWRIYSPVLPATCEPQGTIRRGLGDTGALVRFRPTGLYAQANAGVLRSLDQEAVEQALQTP